MVNFWAVIRPNIRWKRPNIRHSAETNFYRFGRTLILFWLKQARKLRHWKTVPQFWTQRSIWKKKTLKNFNWSKLVMLHCLIKTILIFWFDVVYQARIYSIRWKNHCSHNVFEHKIFAIELICFTPALNFT